MKEGVKENWQWPDHYGVDGQTIMRLNGHTIMIIFFSEERKVITRDMKSKTGREEKWGTVQVQLRSRDLRGKAVHVSKS